MIFIYNIFIYLYSAGAYMASLFNKKAKLWVEGRKDILEKLKTAVGSYKNIVWVHCASLGEFEQGLPVIEALRKNYPDQKILLTFFSPSGYEIRKNYNKADWFFYLPMDTPKNAKQFIELVNPALAIFVKYEYWYNYLKTLSEKDVPTILISAIFRKDSIFFKWYGGLYRRMLGFFSHLFVQNEESYQLIENFVAPNKLTPGGDTRFDRVVEIANGFKPIVPIEIFVQNKKTMVAGSTWPDDEKNLAELRAKSKNKFSLIIAPHEISSSHLQFLKELFPKAILYSDFIKNTAKYNDADVLIIDNIGMLSKLYYYSTISYIGGGFNKSGIHNTLEAAVYCKPVVFGPNYDKFAEANDLIKNRGGFAYKTDNDLIKIIENLISIRELLTETGNAAGKYVSSHTGATKTILEWVNQNVF